MTRVREGRFVLVCLQVSLILKCVKLTRSKSVQIIYCSSVKFFSSIKFFISSKFRGETEFALIAFDRDSGMFIDGDLQMVEFNPLQ